MCGLAFLYVEPLHLRNSLRFIPPNRNVDIAFTHSWISNRHYFNYLVAVLKILPGFVIFRKCLKPQSAVGRYRASSQLYWCCRPQGSKSSLFINSTFTLFISCLGNEMENIYQISRFTHKSFEIDFCSLNSWTYIPKQCHQVNAEAKSGCLFLVEKSKFFWKAASSKWDKGGNKKLQVFLILSFPVWRYWNKSAKIKKDQQNNMVEYMKTRQDF